jgi:hypothetical protein
MFRLRLPIRSLRRITRQNTDPQEGRLRNLGRVLNLEANGFGFLGAGRKGCAIVRSIDARKYGRQGEDQP